MLETNAALILGRIAPHAIVLDVGGWAQPFTRANYVVDIMPYDTRAVFGRIGPEPERFTRETWIVHDLSSRAPLPFRDKEIDYAICSHTLEDIRDPIHLCAELQRVAKRGYVEVPSRVVESIEGLEGRGYAGYYHHRWLVEIENDELVFRHKPHLMHGRWRYHLPSRYLKRLREHDKVAYVFWEGGFRCREAIQVSMLQVARELEDFVRTRDAYPRLRYRLDELRRPGMLLRKRVLARHPALKRMVERVVGRRVTIESDWERFWSRTPEISSR